MVEPAEPRTVQHNKLTEQFLEAFEASGLTAGEFHAAYQPATLGTHFAGRVLTRPGLLERAQVQRLGADLETLYRCVTSLPERLFGGDLGAFARATGVPEQQVDAVVRGRGSIPSRLSRADLYLDDTGFRLMEFNMSAALGGIDTVGLMRTMLSHPFMAQFAAEHNLGYVDTYVEVAETLRAECGFPAGSTPFVAFCDWPASFAQIEPELHKNAAALTRLGMESIACHLGQLRVDDNFDVWLGEHHVDVIYRVFLMEDLLDPAGPGLIEPVLSAAERGKVRIFSPMDAELYGSKGALALLSDEANRRLFSADELDCLDRLLPWTRMIRPGPVTVGGRSVPLEEYAISARQELILKPVMLHGGAGVVPGWLTEPDEWAALIGEAMGRQSVLQRRIYPHTELFPSDDGPVEHLLVWGAFLGTRGYAGMYLRGRPAERGVAVLNVATGAIGSCCFHELG
ncbi:MAG TPA: hypothetical protein VFU36_14510 [Jatrophihabitans sp.]|nr:hypothetical protein [Jatrophihabitans sp.]